MRPRPFLLLIAGVVLVLMAAGEADAGKAPPWDTGKAPLWSSIEDDYTHYVDISADGQYVVATYYNISNGHFGISLFDGSGNKIWKKPTESSLMSVAISADGEYIVGGDSDCKIYFLNNRGAHIWNYTTPGGGCIRSVAISADGEYVVAGTYRQVYLFGKDSSTPLWNYTTGGVGVKVSISANGEIISVGVSGGSGGEGYLFYKNANVPVWNLRDSGIYSLNPPILSLSADGRYTATFGLDKIYLLDNMNFSQIWNYTSSGTNVSDWFYHAAISADGEYIAASTSFNLYFFDKYSNTPRWSYEFTGEALVREIAISSDGDYIAAAVGDSVYCFSKNRSTPLWNYTGLWTSDVAISADGKYVVSNQAGQTLLDANNSIIGYKGGSGISFFINGVSTDKRNDDGFLPAPSLAAAVAAVAVIALRRRPRKP